MATTNLRVFLSWGFEDVNGKKLAEFVRGRLKGLRERTSINVDVVESIDGEPKADGRLTVSQTIQLLIESSRMVVAILGKRYETNLDVDDRWLPTPMVIAESAYALGVHKPVLPLLEQGVMLQGTTFHFYNAENVPRITADGEIVDLDGRTHRTFEQVLDEFIHHYFERVPTNEFRQKMFRRFVKVRDAKIVVASQIDAEILDEDRFRGFAQSIKLRDGWSAPALEDLCNGRVGTDWYLMAKSANRSADDQFRPMKIVAAPELGSSGDRISFRLLPEPAASRGDRIHYEYVYRIPIEACPKDHTGDGCTLLTLETIQGPIEDVELELEFHDGYPFRIEPECRETSVILRDAGVTLDEKTLDGVFRERNPKPFPEHLPYRSFAWGLTDFFGTAIIRWASQ